MYRKCCFVAYMHSVLFNVILFSKVSCIQSASTLATEIPSAHLAFDILGVLKFWQSDGCQSFNLYFSASRSRALGILKGAFVFPAWGGHFAPFSCVRSSDCCFASLLPACLSFCFSNSVIYSLRFNATHIFQRFSPQKFKFCFSNLAFNFFGVSFCVGSDVGVRLSPPCLAHYASIFTHSFLCTSCRATLTGSARVSPILILFPHLPSLPWPVLSWISQVLLSEGGPVKAVPEEMLEAVSWGGSQEQH